MTAQDPAMIAAPTLALRFGPTRAPVTSRSPAVSPATISALSAIEATSRRGCECALWVNNFFAHTQKQNGRLAGFPLGELGAS